MEQNSKVITRFAPSPTGNLHSGSYRTAIFAYLYAKKMGGSFILRIEDTDKDRSKKEYEDNIIDSLNWLGIGYDEFYRQSENIERHREVLHKLIADGFAYVSKEEAKDGSGVIKEIIRFKNPNTDVSFFDEIKGTVKMNTTDLGDFVIAKNINEPLFHLAVVVDDYDEGVTHIIRGEDHVSNTPRQVLIQRAIGAPTPVYAHIPLVLGADKQKLSKRKGALAMSEYKALGYMPAALLNMITMVGWNPGTPQELFSKDELVKEFDLAKVQKSPAVFNPEKLDWFNREYIKKLSFTEFWDYAAPFLPAHLSANADDMKVLHTIEYLIKDRVVKFIDIKNDFENGEYGYFFSNPDFNPDIICWKNLNAAGHTDALRKTLGYLEEILNFLDLITDANWNREFIKQALAHYAEAEGRGNVFWPMRVALSGREKSPDPFELAELLGKERTINRIAAVVARIHTILDERG